MGPGGGGLESSNSRRRAPSSAGPQESPRDSQVRDAVVEEVCSARTPGPGVAVWVGRAGEGPLPQMMPANKVWGTGERETVWVCAGSFCQVPDKMEVSTEI